MKKKVSRGKSKNEWLEVGLNVLGTASVAEISVEALAKTFNGQRRTSEPTR